MTFHYGWTDHINGDTNNDVSLKVRQYDTLEELFEEMYGMETKELKTYEHSGYDGKGKDWNYTFDEMCTNIGKMGCYAFARGKEEIHFWVDLKTVDPLDFIGMMAHEKGHLTRPYKRNPMQEEVKAERYGVAASFAYSMWELINQKEKENE